MKRILPHFLMLAVLLVACLVYRPGLNGGFIFDDYANIVSNSQLLVHEFNLNALKQALFSSASGPLMRPVSMLSFAANYYATGFEPFYFKLTNLIIHLLNGVGIIVLTSSLLNFYRKRFEPDLSVNHAQWVGLAIASAWLLHPLNLTSVLYVVQRMTSLSAFFTIWGLVVFLWGRMRLYEGRSGISLMLCSLLLFTPLAALSKENGALLPLFMLVAEVSLFSFHAKTIAAKRFLIGIYVFSVLLPVIAALTFIAFHPERLLAGYANRSFTIYERFLTEARVLIFYLRQIILPDVTQMGLYLDDIRISRGLFQPVTTLLSMIALAALIALAVRVRKTAPLVTFGALFFFVGHLLESTIYPLDIAYEHRNYLPMYGIVLVMFFYLMHPLVHAGSLLPRKIASALLILMFALGTFSRAAAWANPYDMAQSEFNHHPDSVRANIELASVYDSFIAVTPEGRGQYYLLARQRYEHASGLDGNDTSGLLGLVKSSARRGMPVERAWITELSHRLEHVPYAPITSDKVLDLMTCYLKGECELQSTWVGELLDASLRNRTLAGGSRAKVLYAKSSYLINVERDYQAATEVMRQMIGSAPGEPALRLPLIESLMAMRHFEEAKVEIAKLRQLDTLKIYSERLDELEKLATMQNQPSP